jgi:hypothetical protein
MNAGFKTASTEFTEDKKGDLFLILEHTCLLNHVTSFTFPHVSFPCETGG